MHITQFTSLRIIRFQGSRPLMAKDDAEAVKTLSQLRCYSRRDQTASAKYNVASWFGKCRVWSRSNRVLLTLTRLRLANGRPSKIQARTVAVPVYEYSCSKFSYRTRF
jgi:hypothetical protein